MTHFLVISKLTKLSKVRCILDYFLKRVGFVSETNNNCATGHGSIVRQKGWQLHCKPHIGSDILAHFVLATHISAELMIGQTPDNCDFDFRKFI